MPLAISQEKKDEWKNKIIQQKNSSKSIRKCAGKIKFSHDLFIIGDQKLFPEIISRSSFTELADNKNVNTGVAIEYQGMRICLDKNFDLITLKHCLIALRGMKF